MAEGTYTKGFQLKLGRRPAIYKEIVKAFPEVKKRDIIITYGNKVYSNQPLPDHLIAHETVHCEQQGWNDDAAAKWWDKYLTDPRFRYEQELAAYRAQYKELPDKSAVVSLAKDLSSPMYGGLTSFIKALGDITK